MIVIFHDIYCTNQLTVCAMHITSIIKIVTRLDIVADYWNPLKWRKETFPN